MWPHNNRTVYNLTPAQLQERFQKAIAEEAAKKAEKQKVLDEKNEQRFIEIGRLLSSLTPASFGMVKVEPDAPRATLEEEVVVNVNRFTTAFKSLMGDVSRGTIIANTGQLTAKLCDVNQKHALSCEQRMVDARKKEPKISRRQEWAEWQRGDRIMQEEMSHIQIGKALCLLSDLFKKKGAFKAPENRKKKKKQRQSTSDQDPSKKKKSTGENALSKKKKKPTVDEPPQKKIKIEEEDPSEKTVETDGEGLLKVKVEPDDEDPSEKRMETNNEDLLKEVKIEVEDPPEKVDSDCAGPSEKRMETDDASPSKKKTKRRTQKPQGGVDGDVVVKNTYGFFRVLNQAFGRHAKRTPFRSEFKATAMTCNIALKSVTDREKKWRNQ